MTKLKVGDEVLLCCVPDWLIHDLPEGEQYEILSFIGKTTIITEIDDFGYFWIGFGNYSENEDIANYNGHSFAITSDCLELVQST